MSDFFHALASPVRRKIIQMLKHSDMTAGEIATHFDISKPTLSGHLNTLKQAGLVIAEKEKTTITYKINTSVTEELLVELMALLGMKGDQRETNTDEN